MDEGHFGAAGAGTGSVVDGTQPLGLETGERGGAIVHLDGDVVHAFAALVDKAGQHAVGRGWLQQLYVALADGHEAHAGLLAGNLFHVGAAQAERIRIQGQVVLDPPDRDADVIDPRAHGATRRQREWRILIPHSTVGGTYSPKTSTKARQISPTVA